jgi:DnaJ family protein C protein 19
MSLRAASAGRLALQSRTRLLARTNPSSRYINNNNSWQEYQYSHHRRRSLLSGSVNELHTFATRLSLEDNSEDRDDQTKRRLPGTLPSIGNNNHTHTMTTTSFAMPSTTSRFYHTSPPQERAVAIILGAGALSASAYAASSAITAYKEFQASRPEPPPVEEENATDESDAAGGTDKKQQKEQQEAQQKEKSEPAGPRENIFNKWFSVGSKYYEGGFEETMTRREAALILGIRESSSAKRIKDAHRKLLILNHPDTGGSTYMSLKINEAKELLLKGKGRV